MSSEGKYAPDDDNAEARRDSRSRRNVHRPSGKLLALDVGQARIGVAVCDPLQLRSRPLTVIHRNTRRADFDRLAAIVREEDAQAVVCGLPLNMDGSEGPQARTVRKWAMRLAHALRALLGEAVPVIFWDERLSTYAAEELAGHYDASVGEDAVAAAVILQRYMDGVANTDRPDYGEINLPEKEQPSRPRGEHRAPTADGETIRGSQTS